MGAGEHLRMTREGLSVDHQARAVSIAKQTLRRWCGSATRAAVPRLRPVTVVECAAAGEGIVLRVGQVRVEGLGVTELIAVLRGLE